MLDKGPFEIDWSDFQQPEAVRDAYNSLMEQVRRLDEENRPWWPHKVSIEQDPDDENVIRLKYTPDWNWGNDSIF